MSIARHHAEWLSLVEASGPFLSMKVLAGVFPQGLDDIDPDLRARLRAAHEEWRDDVDGTRPDVAVHHAWIRYVFREALGFGDEDIVPGDRVGLTVRIPEQHETLTPSFAVVNPAGRDSAGQPRLLISVLAATQDPNKPLANRFWKVSPVDRMLFLLRGAQAQGNKVRVGVVTNGDEWVLVHVVPNETATYVTWSSELFFDEPLTLRAFVSLLGLKRFFGVPDAEVIEALFAESTKDQHDVTDQLGLQVRRAVEILVQTIDRLDRDRGRVLLKGIPEATLYDSAVTVMMRLVFLFAAEEKKLLLLGTPLYDENYAVSTLHDQLQATADRHGEEVLERRHDAWSRLLATFRAVFGGIDHTDLRLPAYGGSLFDPDRFPFLEGRTPGTSWRDPGASSPLSVDNRTVLHLLRALQRLQIRFAGGGPAETRRLSFRALDIEQIGHVYEGLLDHTAKRATGLTLSLDGKREPEIALADLEAMRKKAKDAFPAWLAETTGRSAPAIEKALQYEIPKEDQRRWLAVCDSRRPVYERVAPWAGLVRNDSHGNPVVIDEGAVYVTEGSDRRSTGTHYTPRSLTEPIVQHTLDPLVYDGPAEGKPREEWVLKPPKDILALRVCDLAMGSGAFLVQACRYLSQKLVEGWETAEENAGDKLVLAPNGELSKGKPGDTLVPREVEERLVLARRFVADRCLYGVDVNPMAVEMAKLSLWLVTLQKNRPFSFVDHALRCGDSLLGVTSEEQLLYFHLDPARGKKLHDNLLGLDKKIKAELARARELREKLESFPVRDISDSTQKAWLFKQANEATEDLRAIGELLIGAALATAGKKEEALDDVLRDLSPMVAGLLKAGGEVRAKKRGEVLLRAAELFDERRESQPRRRPFHWAIEFPEVMQAGGFAATVGNPPFLSGSRISTTLGGEYLAFFKDRGAAGFGNADLCCYFLRRAGAVVSGTRSAFTLLATSSIAEGDNAQFALRFLSDTFRILDAHTNILWPGTANVRVSHVTFITPAFAANAQQFLNGRLVHGITSSLNEMSTGEAAGDREPKVLHANGGISFKGVQFIGDGFRVDPSELKAWALDAAERRYVRTWLNGSDLWDAITIPERRVIDLYPLDEAEARSLTKTLLGILETRVRPTREHDNRAGYRTKWWLLGENAVGMRDAMKPLSQILARPFLSNTFGFRFLTTKYLPTNTLVVVARNDFGMYAALNSSIHEAWARRYGSRFKSDLRYTPSTCFECFPLPALGPIQHPGQAHDGFREEIVAASGEPFNAVMDRFADPHEHSAPIKKLRALHVEMDEAVKLAYRWNDLSLDHGFHETKQGLRYTISEPARVEVLGRLLELNHVRYTEEAKAGMHENSKGKAKPKPAIGAKKKSPAKGKRRHAGQAGLFADGDDE